MLDIILLCSILAVAFALFASERIRVDLVALTILAVLMTLGLFMPTFPTIEEGVSGFSDKATVTIAAMFVLSSGLTKTGAIGWVSEWLSRLARSSETGLFVVLMAVVG